MEPLLDPNQDRFVIYTANKDIKYKDTWEWYDHHKGLMWHAHEIQDKLSEDRTDWETKLDDDEKHFVKMVLAFFAASDGIVSENLVNNFCNEVQIPEARAFYAMQNLIETVHNETYSLMIVTLINDQKELETLLSAATKIPIIKEMADWTFKWMNKETNSFQERLIAFAVIEGIFFSGPFAAIFWLRDRGLMPGLGKANEFISRDEGFHRDFACHLYRDRIVNKISDERIYEIVTEGTEIAIKFVTESLPVKLIQMNHEDMTRYIKYVADHLLVNLGVDKFYKTKNPFKFAEINSHQVKSNFFEHKSTVYSEKTDMNISGGLEEDDDF